MNISSDYDIIYFKKGSYHSTLARLDDHFLYKSDNIVVKLDLDSFEVMDLSTVKKDNFEIDLREPVEMYLIIEGARSFLK